MENFPYYLDKINSDYGINYTIIRTIVIYIYAVLLIRIGNARFKINTPMDYIFILIIGAVLGRTVYGGASLISTIVASFVLFLMHKIFAKISYKSKRFGLLLKGKPHQLIKDGKIIWENMEKTLITKEDLLQECHNTNCDDLNQIKSAFLERTGKITFIKK